MVNANNVNKYKSINIAYNKLQKLNARCSDRNTYNGREIENVCNSRMISKPNVSFDKKNH